MTFLINDLALLTIIALADHYRSKLQMRHRQFTEALKRWVG